MILEQLADMNEAEAPITIKVVGVGGAGGNVLDRLAAAGMSGADLLAVNTDRQALARRAPIQSFCLGEDLTRGLGAGGDPLVGQRAAEESTAALQKALHGADMVFIAAGMGGGTGTGAAPVVAEIARQQGALTVAIVTRPFNFEGRHRGRVAEQGISQLRAIADTVIIVPNERLIQAAARTTSILTAFGMADTILRFGVQSIADLVARRGLVNVDFADVRTIMGEAGPALLGIGVGRGADRAVEAARKAMACPLLEGQLEGARRLLLNVSGGADLGLFEVNRAAELIASTVDPEANIIFGAMVDPDCADDTIKVTLVATGFADVPPPRHITRKPPVELSEATMLKAPQPQTKAIPSLPSLLTPDRADSLETPPFLLRFRRS